MPACGKNAETEKSASIRWDRRILKTFVLTRSYDGAAKNETRRRLFLSADSFGNHLLHLVYDRCEQGGDVVVQVG
jgi:hypothetical protein